MWGTQEEEAEQKLGVPLEVQFTPMHGGNGFLTSTLFDSEAHSRVLRPHLFLFWLLDWRRWRVLGVIERGPCHGDDDVVGGQHRQCNECTNRTRAGRRGDKSANRVTDGGGIEF